MKNKFYELFYNTIINEYMEKDLWLENLSAIKTLVKEITPTKVFRYRKISDFALSDFDKDILSLPMWEGDYHFFEWLNDDLFHSAKILYENDCLKEYVEDI